MGRLFKLMFPSLLAVLLVLGLSHPVSGQPLPPTLYVEAPAFVNVSTEFDIIIWIRDIPAGWGMTGFDVEVKWDPNDLEFIECEFLGDGRPGWDGGCGADTGIGGGGGSDFRSFPASRWTEDAAWLRFRFHCLREGPSIIAVGSLEDLTIFLEDSGGSVFPTDPEPVEVTVEQGFGAVGGITAPVSKLEILTPYIALAGLIAAVSTVYFVTRRKD